MGFREDCEMVIALATLQGQIDCIDVMDFLDMDMFKAHKILDCLEHSGIIR